MLKPILYLIGGIVVGAMLTANPAVAQQATRLFGTLSNGNAIAIQTDASGNLLVVAN